MSSRKAQGKRPVASPELGGPSTKKAQPTQKELKTARATKPTDFLPVKIGRGKWVSLEGHESQTAAYLGFNSTSDLRAFAISWPVLLAEKYFVSVSKNMSRPGPFTLLDMPAIRQELSVVTTNPETVWKWGEGDIKQRQWSQKKKIVAWCLYKMVENIERYKNATDARWFSPTITPQNLEDSAKEQNDFLERHKGNTMGVVISFPPDMKRFPVPELGPLADKGEGQLEPYNRCWEVLKYLGSGFYKSNWKARFATLQAVEDGTVVSEAHAPSWMQTSQKVASGLSSVKKVFASDNLAPIDIEVRWIRGEDVARDQETEDAIQQARKRKRDVTLPPSIFQLPWDPRIFARSEQFRDSIRRSLNCQELGLDLQSMLLRYHHDAVDGSWHADGLDQDWTRLRGVFENPQHSKFVLEVRLQAFDVEDDMYVLYEDESDPIDQHTYLAIQNSQKMIAQNNQKTANIPELSAGLEGQIQFAKSDGINNDYGASPQKFDTKEEQVAFYNGYDVENPDDRLAWQNNLIQDIAPDVM